MILIEEAPLSDAAMPLDAFKQHLRMGSGFGVESVQDAMLASFLRAAIVAIEARTSKALLRRTFVLTLPAWTTPEGHPLPIAPIVSITQVAIVDRFGHAEVMEAARFRVTPDTHVPWLRYDRPALPPIPTGGTAEVRLVAGYAGTFADLPADLAQAVMLLAAHYYEYRDETALGEGCMPFGVTSLVARYRRTRIGFAS
ncbi:gene transfer agent protein [Roseivivax halodurans JCM 10272]|uniref:Gene transfer agent protein n=1 Tax=Roseivivax halodurans JCM 10272 TaxID=1449350 RepID=X7EJ67_9RHOB|nr:head-tail connector protein [Roseivivax halodurans]ETX16164.1 gene transfer agent protein [Roseivivax halodurans JCM 10272]